MHRKSATINVILCFWLFAASWVLAADAWFLMSRHGTCEDVEVLKRKVPDLGDVRDPDAFALLMQQQGYKVTSTMISVPRGAVRQVDVPDKGLYLMFVNADICKEMGAQ